MISFNMKLDPDICEMVDAERKNRLPRCSRVAFIEAILYARYKDKIQELRAKRQEQASDVQLDVCDPQTIGATN